MAHLDFQLLYVLETTENKMPRNVFEMLVHMKMLDEGIVPYGIVPPAILKQLEEMPTSDRRKMKRKFRKLWRKAYKKYDLAFDHNPDNKVPRHEKSRRLAMVYRVFREDVLNHMKD